MNEKAESQVVLMPEAEKLALKLPVVESLSKALHPGHIYQTLAHWPPPAGSSACSCLILCDITPVRVVAATEPEQPTEIIVQPVGDTGKKGAPPAKPGILETGDKIAFQIDKDKVPIWNKFFLGADGNAHKAA